MTTINQEKLTIRLSPEIEEELSRFKSNITDLRSGKLDPDEFKKFRLNNGVYGIRNEPTLHMIRIKCPHGEITADQLDAVAEIAESYTRTKQAHVTTRQAIQMHHIALDHIVMVLRRLNETGLTTREACGNTVRNMTATPFAGFLPDEVFDVTPYAEVLYLHFLRNPLGQNLPRKFKVSFFGGGKDDIAYTAINDIGFVAAKRIVEGKEEKGFHVYVGGGLGATPHLAIRLEEFTPLSEFFPTAEAILRIFDRHGNRKDKLHARLKFVVQKFGDEEFRKLVFQERVAVRATRAGGWGWTLPQEAPLQPPVLAKSVPPQSPQPGFERWKTTNAIPQKHSGYTLVIVVTPLGDITVPQMRRLANLARTFNGGRLRTMVQQNFLLPWIKNEHLPALFNELSAIGLATGGALRFSDVTRCPGADTCQIAITKSRGLASAILDLFKDGLSEDVDMKDLTIKISGCTNSCGQHHIGNIGFFGTYRTINGREVPHYQLLLGGDIKEGSAKFGTPILAIPARRAPEAVKKLVSLYKSERQLSERFVETMGRLGRARLKTEIEPFAALPSYEENPSLYTDWGDERAFRAEVGKGECAA